LPRTFDNYEPKYNIENITNNNTSIPNNPMVDDFTKQPQSQMRDYSNERNQNQNNRQFKENVRFLVSITIFEFNLSNTIRKFFYFQF
jgi:hypothetical protein